MLVRLRRACRARARLALCGIASCVALLLVLSATVVRQVPVDGGYWEALLMPAVPTIVTHPTHKLYLPAHVQLRLDAANALARPRFLAVWISHETTWTARRDASLESMLAHHPHAQVVIITMDGMLGPRIVQPFERAGYDVLVVSVNTSRMVRDGWYLGENSKAWATAAQEHLARLDGQAARARVRRGHSRAMHCVQPTPYSWRPTARTIYG